MPAEEVDLRATFDPLGHVWTLVTRLGRLDLMSEPAPGFTYARLLASSRVIRGKQTYRVASIEDLVTMKRAAGRPKDVGHLEILQMAAEEIDKRSRDRTS